MIRTKNESLLDRESPVLRLSTADSPWQPSGPTLVVAVVYRKRAP